VNHPLPADPTLAATALIDSDHAAVAAFGREHARGRDDRERAVALYHAVRDRFRYDPYRIDLSDDGMRASTVIGNGYGWCVPKAALLAAACRASGIPARVGFADVRNHLSTERMRAILGTDLYIWHGYTEIRVGDRWFKATPAFNIELCERFGLKPLDFDGRTDSIYHPYDRHGQRHMEYVNQRGSFDDMPLARIRADFARDYPRWIDPLALTQGADFLADVDRETGQ
jgi:transglutaminase-like putative cysteine protease